MHTANNDQNRFKRFRDRRKAQGMKELRMWVFDPQAHEIKREARRQSLSLRNDSAEAETMDFIEAVSDWGD
ncbi:MAG: antitoxin MazE-like protein [Pseudomonadota bacterium]|nr:antitoxin MazE-like protein [Pseudomonadota bacterium]